MTTCLAESPEAADALLRPAGLRAAARRPAVAIVLPTLEPGGAEISMLRLAGAFQRAGSRVAVVVLRDTPEGASVGPPPDGVEHVVLGAGHSRAAAPALARFARAWRPDVLLSAISHVNLAAIAAARMAGVRAVVTEHAPVRLLADSRGGWKYRALPACMRLAYPFADAVVAVSSGIERELRDLVPRARLIRHISNPIVDDDLEALAGAPMERPWPWADGAPIILGVGRLSPEKDFTTLIEAAALLSLKAPARLAILGEGPERGRLEACAARLGLDVFMPGFVANPLAYMHRADLVALTSRFEGFGNVLVEAMACGAKVVATDAPCGPREILQDGCWGALTPPGDAAAMAREMLAALDSPAPAGSAAYARRFTADAAAESYLALFDEVLAG